jgi:hypothetical protein
MYEKHFHRHAPTSLSPRQHKHSQHVIGDEDAVMKAFLSTLEQEWSCVPRWSKTWLAPIVSGPGL